MAELSLTKRVKAPLDIVWAVWDDYGNVDKFHPLLSDSHIVANESLKTGIGAKRQCNLKDGKNWIREEIIEHTPNEKIVINAYDGTMPLKKAVVSFDFKAINAQETDVTVHMNFEPKMGVIGKIMAPMMKGKFQKMMGTVLEASADYAEQQVS